MDPSLGRLELLRGFAAANPRDPFPRYGLAMELKVQGRHQEAADTFAALMMEFPDYTATYYHAGGNLVALGLASQAKVVYMQGIDACKRKGDHHALGEIQQALDEIESSA